MSSYAVVNRDKVGLLTVAGFMGCPAKHLGLSDEFKIPSSTGFFGPQDLIRSCEHLEGVSPV